MVDIHTHILPAIDDGAESIEEAFAMLKVAKDSGTSELVLTPHFLTCDMRASKVPVAEIRKRFEEFKTMASEEFPDLKLYLGSETFAVDNIRDFIESKNILTINDTRYVMLEFDFDDTPKRAAKVFDSLSAAGYIPIIVHPERYGFVKKNPRNIVPFLEKGALLQINSESLMGRNGHASNDVALSFIENGLAAVIASDCHSISYRSPDMMEIYEFVLSEFSSVCAEVLFDTNSRRILKGETIG